MHTCLNCKHLKKLYPKFSNGDQPITCSLPHRPPFIVQLGDKNARCSKWQPFNGRRCSADNKAAATPRAKLPPLRPSRTRRTRKGRDMKIRFLVHTVSSKTDINGNRYHYAVITSTETGRTLCVKNLGGDSNGRHLVRRALDTWEGIHNEETSLPIREWQRRHKSQKENGALYEHEITPEMILALESAEAAN